MKFISLMATMPSRRNNLPVIRDNYLDAIFKLDGRARFEWHLIYWPSEVIPGIEDELRPVPVRVFSVEPTPGLIPFRKSQSVLDILCSEPRDDPDTFICLMSDDDLISNNLLLRLANAFERTGKPLLIGAAARGQQIAKSGHGDWPLLPVRENMRQCLVTGEQVWIHLDLFCGSEKWGNARRLPSDDGLFIQQLNIEHPDWLEFIPDAWMLFNALEPGRWTDPKELERYLNL